MKVTFTIPGEPCGKGRPRFSRAGAFVKTYTPQKTVNYENLVKLEYQNQCGSAMFSKGVPIDMRVIAYYSIPKSASRKTRERMLSGEIRPLKKPDSSNVVKAIEDALNQIAYSDDAQIVDSQIRRFYGDPPHVVVRIQEVLSKEENAQ